MAEYEIEFRDIGYAGTVYRILKSELIKSGSFDLKKIKKIKSSIKISPISPDIFSKLEKIVEGHSKQIKKIYFSGI